MAGDSNTVTSYQPALDINQLKASTVLNMLETDGSTDLHFEETKSLMKVRELVDDFKGLRNNSDKNILLKDL